MAWLTLLSICITAVATCFIARYSKVSADLTKEIKDQEKSYRDSLENLTKQHQSELRDLYQAIIISTLIGSHSTAEETIKKFERLYTGKVNIFKRET